MDQSLEPSTHTQQRHAELVAAEMLTQLGLGFPASPSMGKTVKSLKSTANFGDTPLPPAMYAFSGVGSIDGTLEVTDIYANDGDEAKVDQQRYRCGAPVKKERKT